jgi:hypothetical protein
VFAIRNTSEDYAHFIEMCLIDHYGRLNDGTGTLENKTDGGEGSSGRIVSEETKKKLQDLSKGKTHSEETKQKMKGRIPPNKGQPMSEEQKRKLSRSHKGKTLSEEHKQKLSDVNKGINHPFYGKTHSEETKQRMSDAKKSRYR